MTENTIDFPELWSISFVIIAGTVFILTQVCCYLKIIPIHLKAGFMRRYLILHLSAFFLITTPVSGQNNREISLNAKQGTETMVIDRAAYAGKLEGFWLGTCLANWTGLITEMDKIGNTGELKTGNFYTRDDWGKPDQPSIWGQGIPSILSPVIGFVYAAPDSVWGADDDTDIEYMYQEMLLNNKTSVLSGEQIRDGWLRHIPLEEENYLWVSNQRAYDLMRAGLLPPETGYPKNNPDYEMIDAQLTTEIFGLFAPGRPDIALRMAALPVQTTACGNSRFIAEFYIILFSLAPAADESLPIKDRLMDMAEAARKHLPDSSYASAMYDFVKQKYLSGIPWEETRDSVYYRYQVQQADAYNMTSRNLYCNGCFAAGINFAASLISLFYGEGDFRETIRIGALVGWDSDNPTATWGGLLGFMQGKNEIERIFEMKFSDKFNIHRTRQGFANNGIDTFGNMAHKGMMVIDRVVEEEMQGETDLKTNEWIIPLIER